MGAGAIMPFDPTKPFDVVTPSQPKGTAFDPSKPFDVVTPSATPVPAPSRDQAERPGALQSIGEGLMTPVYGAAQLAEHIVPINNVLHSLGVPGVKSTAEIDAQMDKRKHDLLAEDDGKINWWRLAGEVASPINYAGSAVASDLNGLGNLARSVLAGMWSGAIEPTGKTDSFAKEKTKQIAEGAIGGAAAHGAGAVVSGVIDPLSAEAKLLNKEGVRLTPGEVMGGIARRGEEAMRSVPFLGQAIRQGESISREDFNRAVYNRALAPIGEKYTGGAVGNEGIDHLEKQIGAAYDRVLPQVRFTADRQLANDITNLRTLVSEMPPDHAQQFQNIYTNRVWQRLKPTGTMNGQTFKQVESELSAMAAKLRPSRDMADRQLADGIDSLNALLRDNLARQNPNQRAELDAANRAWMMYSRVRRAAANRATSGGEFTPADLLASLKASDISAGKGQFAKGQAPMQDLASAGSKVLRSNLSDSGTPERHLWTSMLGGGAAAAGGAYGATHGMSPEMLAAIAGSAGLYTAPGMSALQAATNFMQPTRSAVAPIFLDPWMGALGGAIAGQR